MGPARTKRKGNKHGKRRKKAKVSRSNGQEIIIPKQTKPTSTPCPSSQSPSKSTSTSTKSRNRSLAKREVKPLPFSTKKTHLTEEDGAEYKECLSRVYCGFAVERLEHSSLRARIEASMERLARDGFFHYDIVQYGKGKLNSTRVQRILVGKPGITYLYQNLRLFAFPWDDESIADGALIPIRDLNKHLEHRSKSLQHRKSKASKHVSARSGHGRCDFNLTLINASNVEAASETVPQQRHVPLMHTDFAGNVAVNWHRDSTLVANSTIAVYNHTPIDAADPWRIAMRPYDGNAAPAVSVKLKDNDCYFMLGDFNHHHVHAVLAGKTTRFASTHRVALQANATYASILARTERTLARHRNLGKMEVASGNRVESQGAESIDADAVRAVGETLNVLEFDWIRQFYVQGAVHANQHKSWWKPRIEALVNAWGKLEAIFSRWVRRMLDRSTEVAVRTLNMAVYVLTERLNSRREWEQRYQSKLYRKMPEAFRPMKVPLDIGRFAITSPAFGLEDTLKKLNARVSAQ